MNKKLEELARTVRDRELLNKGVNTIIWNSQRIFEFIKEYVSIYAVETVNKITDESSKVFYIKDYNSKLPIFREVDFDRLIGTLVVNIKINDFSRTVRDVVKRLSSTPLYLLGHAKTLKLPPNHIILAKNCILNLKTMEYSYDVNYFGEYDFINYLPINIKHINDVDPYMYEIVKRIMADWSQGDSEKLHYLKQLAFAAAEGNGRNVFNVLIGSGGNGKSTFLNILEVLAGRRYTTKLNLQDYMDDNKLIGINESTKLIVGHDLASHAKLSSSLNSRFKEFVTNEPFMINVKYKPSKLIKSNALKIQSTNTLLDIFENTDAMKRRLRLFEWTDKNFSNLNDENIFDLTSLTQPDINGNYNEKFYEAFIAFIFTDMTYFKEFNNIESMKNATNNMINSSDNVYNFLEWYVDQELDLFEEFPAGTLYKLFIYWMSIDNPGSTPMKHKVFTERIKKLLPQFNMKLSDKRVRPNSISKLKFNPEIISDLYLNGKHKFTEKSLTFTIMSNNKIDNNEIIEFKNKISNGEILDYDLMSLKEMIICEYLISEGNTDAISIKN